jgi:hypothetical protein
LLYVLKVFLLINYLLSLDEADYLDNIYIYIDNLGYKGQQSASSQETFTWSFRGVILSCLESEINTVFSKHNIYLL